MRISSYVGLSQGAGHTCLFFHKPGLSQQGLAGKHPSSTGLDRCNEYLKLSGKQRDAHMAYEEIIRVGARPPFLRFRPGIDRSRHSPFMEEVGGFQYINFSPKHS